MPLAAGTRLGPYEVLGLIGAGGMGEVYKARDTRLDRTVAIKVLPAELSSDPERCGRFEREARTIAGLNHPHICTLYDVGEHAGSAYLVMEHLQGETLADRLLKGRLPLEQALTVATEVAGALAAAHGQGVVHRDLKPGNVMLTKTGVKLLDFGIAKLVPPGDVEGNVPAATTRNATELGARMGTAGYMAPEQVRGLPVDPRTDIFAFGVVLYEMLAGRRAFPGDTSADALAAILTRNPAPLTGPTSSVPPALSAIVTRCLEKPAEKRFQTARDLGFALQAAGTLSGAEAGEPALPHHREQGPRWWRWAALAGALGVVAVVGTVVVSWLRVPVPSAVSTLSTAPGSADVRLAVLPFVNVSGDSSQEWFADGVTGELTTKLAQVRALKVTSSTSAMTFKRSTAGLRDIARRLNVEWLVEGTVQRAGERVRMTAKLINATTDAQAWAETYDRELTDILTMQAQMAQSVAHAVGALLTPQERLRLVKARPITPEVFDLSVRGWQALNKGGPDDFNAAIDFFSRAAERDSTYAPAHAGLSLSYFTAALYNLKSYRDVLPRAKAAARRAVALDDSLPDAHAALAGAMMVLDWDWAGADREYRRVLDLAPDSSVAGMWAAWYLTIVEQFDEAIAIRRRCLSLDPLSVPANDALGWGLLYAGRYDESIRQYEKLLEIQPDHPYAYLWLSFNYVATSQAGRVMEMCQKADKLAPGDVLILVNCAGNLALVGRHAAAMALMGRITDLSKKTPVEPYFLAYAYAGLGEKARALELLERTVEERSPNAVMLNLDFARTLGSEPRYQALMRKMSHPARTTTP